jgi:AraC-like DNA-binding protein
LISEYIISNELIKYRREKWVEILKENIDANLSNPPSITDMARLVHHSESFLSHNFYKYFGASPKKYTQAQRMRQADKLLRSGKKVFEVADMLGFYDEFHFSKAFKKYWRKSPSEIIAEAVGTQDSQ